MVVYPTASNIKVSACRGVPACLEAFKIATEVLKEVDDARK